MEPLAGWTVAVTADRRAEEQLELLERRGASVLHAPTITTKPLGPEGGLRRATEALLERPPDVLVATTALGMRGWFASTWAWGRAEALHEALATTTIVARGPKASSAVIGEGLPVHWRAPQATSGEILDHLRRTALNKRRLAVQLAGRRDPHFSEALLADGADLVELPVYEWTLPAAHGSVQRLVASIIAGDVDAVTFTCSYALTNLVEMAGPDAPLLIDCFRTRVVAACIGPVTAAAARRSGFELVATADPARLGAMVRVLGEQLKARRRTITIGSQEAVLQGASLGTGASGIALTRRERALLECLIEARGAVLSKQRLAQRAWDVPPDDHTVEVAVNRLRRKLGPMAPALQTTNRRGYRLLCGEDLTSAARGPRASVHHRDLPA